MSYDLSVWTALEPATQPLSLSPQSAAAEGRGWQIVVSTAVPVQAEDVPIEVAAVIAGVRFLTALSLEPIGAPNAARTRLFRIARDLARSGHGVVLDPQADSVITPPGVRRDARPQRRPGRASLLQLEWWWRASSPLHTDEGLNGLVDLLSSTLPEALPRRFGEFEPPPYVTEDVGLDRFREFLMSRPLSLVWRPQRPLVGVYLWHMTDRPRSPRFGHLKIDVETEALQQPGWDQALLHLWWRLSEYVQPIYSHVQTVAGYLPARGGYYSDMETEPAQVKGPWWMGIPRNIGHACALGPPYLDLWPAFRDRATRSGELGLITAESWRTGASAHELVGRVPEPIAQRHTPRWGRSQFGGYAVTFNEEYPPVWPFERT